MIFINDITMCCQWNLVRNFNMNNTTMYYVSVIFISHVSEVIEHIMKPEYMSLVAVSMAYTLSAYWGLSYTVCLLVHFAIA